VRSGDGFNSFRPDDDSAIHQLTFIFKFAKAIRVFPDVTVGEFQRNSPDGLNVQLRCDVFRYPSPCSARISEERNLPSLFWICIVDDGDVNVYVSHFGFSLLHHYLRHSVR